MDFSFWLIATGSTDIFHPLLRNSRSLFLMSIPRALAEECLGDLAQIVLCRRPHIDGRQRMKGRHGRLPNGPCSRALARSLVFCLGVSDTVRVLERVMDLADIENIPLLDNHDGLTKQKEDSVGRQVENSDQ